MEIPCRIQIFTISITLQWRHDGCNGVSNHQPRHCLLNLFSGIDKTLKLRVIGLCAGNSPVTGEYVSIWWRHLVTSFPTLKAYTRLPQSLLISLLENNKYINTCSHMDISSINLKKHPLKPYAVYILWHCDTNSGWSFEAKMKLQFRVPI